MGDQKSSKSRKFIREPLGITDIDKAATWFLSTSQNKVSGDQSSAGTNASDNLSVPSVSGSFSKSLDGNFPNLESDIKTKYTYGRKMPCRTSTWEHEEDLNESSILFDKFLKEEELREKSLLSQQSKQSSIEEESSGYDSSSFNETLNKTNEN